jgi:hypothetical protein
MYLEQKVKNFIVNSSGFIRNIAEIVARANKKEVQNIPKPKIPLFRSVIIPGSPRGVPKKLESYDGKILPNAYQEILQDSKRFPMFKAWYSLLLEKIGLVLKVEFISAFIVAAIKFNRFTNTKKEVIMRKYGDCVFEIAEEMKKGNMTLRDGLKEGAKIPVCFQNLINSGLDEETLTNMLIRADFFSAGEEGSEYWGFVTREMFERSTKEYIFRLFTGPLAQYIWEGLLVYFPMFYEAERTGDENPLQNVVRQINTEAAPILNSLDSQIIDAARPQIDTTQIAPADTTQNTPVDTTRSTVPIRSRTSRRI